MEVELLQDYFWRGYEYSEILLKLDNSGYKMSLSSLKRRLRTLGLGRRNYCESQATVAQVIANSRESAGIVICIEKKYV